MGKANSDMIMVEVMKYLCRANQVDTYTKEICTMKASFDEALTRQSSASAASAASMQSHVSR